MHRERERERERERKVKRKDAEEIVSGGGVFLSASSRGTRRSVFASPIAFTPR